MKTEKYNQLLLSGKIGDGCYVTQTSEKLRFGEYRYSMSFTSKNLDYLAHKKLELKKLGVVTGKFKKVESGYKKGNFSSVFYTRVHPYLTKIGNISILECVNNLNMKGLIYYYLDDGTYHQKRHFMQLYCNTFNEEEVNALIEKIYEIYPIKRCSKRWDRKKDGRKYPYLYIPVSTSNIFKEDVKNFLINNDIPSMLYKSGSPSTTIESVN